MLQGKTNEGFDLLLPLMLAAPPLVDSSFQVLLSPSWSNNPERLPVMSSEQPSSMPMTSLTGQA